MTLHNCCSDFSLELEGASDPSCQRKKKENLSPLACAAGEGERKRGKGRNFPYNVVCQCLAENSIPNYSIMDILVSAGGMDF
jgi:hypothetical protein